MTICEGRLYDGQVVQLLQSHLDDMAQHSPPESIHALDLDALAAPDVTFWSAWDGDHVMGCAALKELSVRHAEIKSMRTSSMYLRQGVARDLLMHVVSHARRQSYARLSLETGSASVFEPARALYLSVGFTYCDPFANYQDDSYSLYMTLALK